MENVCTVTQIRLGEGGGGGGDTIGGGGGSANREPGSYIYIYIYVAIFPSFIGNCCLGLAARVSLQRARIKSRQAHST